MIYTTCIPFLRDYYHYSLSDRYGAMVVHDDLLVQSLMYGIATTAEIVCDGFADNSGPVKHITSILRSSLAQLPAGVARRVKIRCLAEDSAQLWAERVLVGKLPEFGQLCNLRSASATPFPVCGLMHSAVFPQPSRCLALHTPVWPGV